MGTLLKYEFRRSRTIFLGIIGVTLLVELVYLVGFFTKVQALFTVGLIGGILSVWHWEQLQFCCTALSCLMMTFPKSPATCSFHATQCRTDRGCKAF